MRMNATRKEDNISVVTSKLFGLILKMPFEERRQLLTQVERQQAGPANQIRRKYDRQNHLINVDYSVRDQLYNGFAVNFSANGVFIESPKTTLPKFSPGDQVILSFDHPQKREHMKISGHIARIRKNGIGVSFDRAIVDWWTP